MKTTPAIILAGALLAAPYTVTPQEKPQPQPKIESFLEGLCIGLIVGLTVDTFIVIGVECYKARHTTNAPPVMPPPPAPRTNSFPPTNTISGVLRSGPGAMLYTNGSFQTMLEQSSGTNWAPLYVIQGWDLGGGSWRVLVQDTNGIGILTNDGPILQALPLAMPTNGQKQFFRLSAP